MANGGVIAPVGMNMVALAAQRHAVPFVVVAGSHKVDFCTLYLIFATFVPKNNQCLHFTVFPMYACVHNLI
jgi:translation initiation factor 2B subunit (eIF-2B alpha/beta/delta family)